MKKVKDKSLEMKDIRLLLNPSFKGIEFDRFRKETRLDSFNLTPHT